MILKLRQELVANAFAYFTQISWYAFLRRIEKEKKQQDIKLKYIANVGIDDLVDTQGDVNPDESTAFVDNLRSRIDGVRANDLYWKDIVTEEKKKTRKRRAVNVDSDLKDFLKVYSTEPPPSLVYIYIRTKFFQN